MRKSSLIALIILVLVVAYFFDNIRGYYRFKELCDQEKLQQVTNKLERDVGWQIDLNKPSNEYSALVIASLPYVRFVRFVSLTDKKLYDMYYVGKSERLAEILLDPRSRGDWQRDYEISPADLKNPVMYQWSQFEEALPTEVRTSRYGEKIVDLRSGKVVLSLTNIGYDTFDRNHTLLDAPSGNTCEWYNAMWRNQKFLSVFQ